MGKEEALYRVAVGEFCRGKRTRLYFTPAQAGYVMHRLFVGGKCCELAWDSPGVITGYNVQDFTPRASNEHKNAFADYADPEGVALSTSKA